MPVLAFVMSALVLVGAIAEAQTARRASGLAAVRARLVAPNGTLLIAPESNVDLDAGAMTAAEGPDLVALALACTGMPARTQVTILGTMTGAGVKAKIERDKGGRLEVQLRGIPFADRARLLEVTEAFLAKGAYDVRVEGPVAGRNIEARIRERVPEAMPFPTAALPPPTPRCRGRGATSGALRALAEHDHRRGHPDPAASGEGRRCAARHRHRVHQ